MLAAFAKITDDLLRRSEAFTAGQISMLEHSVLRRLDDRISAFREDEHHASLGTDSSPLFDIPGVVGAVQLAAQSLSSMADRISDLEARRDLVAQSNETLLSQNQELALQLEAAIEQSAELAASLEAEIAHLQKLEALTAKHISHAGRLEKDLESVHADLASVVAAISDAFGAAP